MLVRCAGCGRNFEARQFGQQSCPICGAILFLDPPAGKPIAPIQITPSSDELPPATDSSHHERPLKVFPGVPSRVEAVPHPGHSPDPKPFRLSTAIQQILFHPIVFFRDIRLQGYMRALLFGWIVFTLAHALSSGYLLYSFDHHPDSFLKVIEQNTFLKNSGFSSAEHLPMVRLVLLVLLIGSPVLGIINLFASAGLCHVAIRMLFRNHRGFRGTFYAISFSALPLVFMLIPEVGMYIGSFWNFILQTIALTQIHRMDSLRAVIAILAPTLLLNLLVWLSAMG